MTSVVYARPGDSYGTSNCVETVEVKKRNSDGKSDLVVSLVIVTTATFPQHMSVTIETNNYAKHT